MPVLLIILPKCFVPFRDGAFVNTHTLPLYGIPSFSSSQILNAYKPDEVLHAS